MHAAQAAAFDHRRPAHADAGAVGGDDHVAAAQQRGIAGKTAAVHDADHRHLAGQAREALEGGAVQPGDGDRIDIARPAAATFGKQHQRQALLLAQLEQPVALAVVEEALRAGQHGVVVGHDRDTRALGTELARIDAAGAGDQPVGRRVALQVVQAAPAALRRHREGAVLEQAAGVEQIVDVLARSAPALRMAPLHGLGAGLVAEQPAPVEHGLQIGARARRVGRRRGRRRHRGRDAGLQLDQQRAFADHVAHGRADGAHDAGFAGLQRHLHLHRLEQQQCLTGTHRLAHHHLDADHRAMHR